MEMFEKASRLKLRFQYNGSLSSEDLWDLSLEHLDALYLKLKAEAKEVNQDGLLSKPTRETRILDIKIQMVKRVFEVKQAEAEARKTRAERRAKKERLMEVLAEKQDKAVSRMSADKIESLINELEAEEEEDFDFVS